MTVDEIRKALDEYDADDAAYSGEGVSSLPCNLCAGEVVEYSIPNDIWNKVIRLEGHEHDKEYLCIKCFYDALRVALRDPDA